MRRLVFATVLFLLTLIAPAVVHADVTDFRITEFASEQTLEKSGGRGSLHIVEHISVKFTDNNHGLLRSIPNQYHGRSLSLHVESVSSGTGAPAAYTKYESNGNTVLQIGDPVKTVTGNQEYTIDYTIFNVMAGYADYDELYWNVNGADWGQPVDKVSATVHLPTDAPLLMTRQPICYAGTGSNTDQKCKIEQKDSTLKVSATNLLPYQSLTYVVGFDKNYFSPSAATTAASTGGVNDFIISKFASDQTLTRDDKQGTLRIVERIEVEFSGYNHGILRVIPNSYKWHPLKFHLNSITSETSAPTDVSISNKTGNVILKIGSPDSTVTGHQVYTIDYTLQNVIGFYDGHDELYWDVNGDEWTQQITGATVTLHLPSDLRLIKADPKCYTGAFGAKQSNCTITRDGNTIRANAAYLGGHETLTYVVGFQEGYFSQATIFDWVSDYALLLIGVAALPMLALLGGFAWWYRKGRDAAGRGTIVPQYTPPADISPVQAGAILDFAVDNRDITAMFIDLARRKYIKIIETHVDRILLKDKITYSLVLINIDTSQLSRYEKALLSGAFTTYKNEETIQLSELKNKFYKTAEAIRRDVSRDLATGGYFRQDPKKFLLKASGLFSFVYLAFLLFGVAIQLHLIGILIGTIFAGIILFLFARAIPARTTKGVDAKEQLLGLKMYMETAEKDRMKMLESPNAPYAANAGAPQRTVELFEQLLPYAIVMKVEKEWAEQFKNIYPAPPDWYGGNITAFNTGYLIGSLNSGFASTVNTSFSAPSSSGSSGFGGGGFSGGGGGGGGGGGW